MTVAAPDATGWRDGALRSGVASAEGRRPRYGGPAPRRRGSAEAAALVRCLDTAPLRATLAAGLDRRLAEGSFWRR